LSRDLPPFERLPKPDLPPAAEASARQFNPFLVFGIPLLFVLTLYIGLVVLSQVDDKFRKGNEFGIGFLASLPGVEDSENPESASIEERINIVILGLDLRRDEPDNQAARTDSVMVLTIDPFAKTSGVLSIPRDMWVEIPDGFGGYRLNRINVAFELGEHTYLDYPGGGAGLVKDTIAHNFDIPIDYYDRCPVVRIRCGLQRLQRLPVLPGRVRGRGGAYGWGKGVGICADPQERQRFSPDRTAAARRPCDG
jgi:hypothetical protein